MEFLFWRFTKWMTCINPQLKLLLHGWQMIHFSKGSHFPNSSWKNFPAKGCWEISQKALASFLNNDANGTTTPQLSIFTQTRTIPVSFRIWPYYPKRTSNGMSTTGFSWLKPAIFTLSSGFEWTRYSMQVEKFIWKDNVLSIVYIATNSKQHGK